MKFRGKLVDIGCVQHFTRVVNTISKLIKTCILRITTDKLYFILSEKLVHGGVQIWCELPQDHFFNEYAMEGVSKDANEIYLEFSPENLLRAMKTAHSAKSVKIKLTKKQVPCITVEIDQPTLAAHSRLVVHDIPVSVIPRRHWQDFDEPLVPRFDVSVSMPMLKTLKNVVDKMKNMSNYMVLSANQNGEMKLMVETDMVSVATHFRDLMRPWNQDTSSQSQERDPDDFVEARIDLRKFSQFLAGLQGIPTRLICNIVHRRIVHLFLLQDDVSLQYFMPVVTA